MYAVWDNSSLSALFTKPVSITSPFSAVSPTKPGQTSAVPYQPRSKPSIAPIVGGTIGGVALLVGIATALWIIVIRPKRTRNHGKTSYKQVPKPVFHELNNSSELGTAQQAHELDNGDMKTTQNRRHQQAPVELDSM